MIWTNSRRTGEGAGDQTADLPREHWAEIGRDSQPHTAAWSWTILGYDSFGNPVEIATGYGESEQAVKDAVEQWCNA